MILPRACRCRTRRRRRQPRRSAAMKAAAVGDADDSSAGTGAASVAPAKYVTAALTVDTALGNDSTAVSGGAVRAEAAVTGVGLGLASTKAMSAMTGNSTTSDAA